MRNLQPIGSISDSRAVIGSAVLLLLSVLSQASTAAASVLATTDAADVAAFQSGRSVLGFDEIVVPAGPCFVELDPNQYAALGIVISAGADGLDRTHVARLPGCGNFGFTGTHTPPNIIGGGVNATTGWREAVRFDFPTLASAIGAHTDGTGSNTTLTAFAGDGSVIASVSGDQGFFLGIAEPNIAYALWEWNFNQGSDGFSLDNVTFSASTSVPALAPYGIALLASLLLISAWFRLTRLGS
jgi:hypothetical protein